MGQNEAVQAVVHSTRCSAGVKLARAPGGKPAVPRADRHRQDTRSGDDGPRRCSESRRAAIKINCAEFQHSHEIAKLIGSRPGYLGHRETHPLIKQEVLAKYHSDALKISFLLFDEIEKASDALWQLLLGILDKATLTLGENRRLDLSQTMIFMTSNLGGSEITKLMTGGIGFEPSVRAESKPRLDEKGRFCSVFMVQTGSFARTRFGFRRIRLAVDLSSANSPRLG